MRISLVTIGEPLPTDAGNQKLLRTGILCRHLVSLGHDVTWWTSTFNHSTKKQRSNHDKVELISNNYKIVQLYAPSYKRNISIWRIINHFVLASKLFIKIKKEISPDVLVVSYPAIEVAFAASIYAKKNSVPYILDARDMWPDMIYTYLGNGFFSTVVCGLLSYMDVMAKYAFKGAKSIIGITEGYVKWGASYAARKVTSMDRAFYLTSKSANFDKQDMVDAYNYWGAEIPNLSKNSFVICFFGIISRRKFDLDSVIAVAERLSKEGRDIQFVICGDGDDLLKYRKNVTANNVVFPGWVDAPKITSLMRISDIGLAPYKSTADFRMSLPIKLFEYLSEGLPILSCLKGETFSLIKEEKIGLTYEENNIVSLYDSIVKLADDNKYRDECAKKALKLYNVKFNQESVFNKMVRHVEMIGGQ